jgi:hypothetical protein
MNNSSRLRWTQQVARILRGVLSIFLQVNKPIGKRPLVRYRHRWKDNIRVDLKEIVSIQGIGLIRPNIGIIGEPL